MRSQFIDATGYINLLEEPNINKIFRVRKGDRRAGYSDVPPGDFGIRDIWSED